MTDKPKGPPSSTPPEKEIQTGSKERKPSKELKAALDAVEAMGRPRTTFKPH